MQKAGRGKARPAKRKVPPAGTEARSRLSQGWRTTDEEEIERRRSRAAEETFEIEPAEPAHPRFGSFLAGLAGGGKYLVEIRSLDGYDNSCGCPDFRINGLDFCKHIAAVLARLGRTRGSRSGRGGSPARAASERIEIFLRRAKGQPRVSVLWPLRAGDAARQLVAPFFGAGGKLKGDPLKALPELARRLERASLRVRGQIRLSRHLMPWVEEARGRAARAEARRRFLASVEAGKQSLDLLKRPLFSYQHEGMLHLAFGERALLADEMGLGKTVQAIAASELLRRLRGVERALVVCPASLKGEWQEQIAAWSDLTAKLIEGPRALRLRQYREGAFFYLASYEQVLTDGDDLIRLLAPEIVILDEAQRIKNWRSKTAQAVKKVASPFAFVLTGTPLENRIDEVYSIVQFLDPELLGPLFRFNREFYALDHRGRPVAPKNLAALRERLRAVLLRRRKDEVEGQLPPRTSKTYLVPMVTEQQVRYAEYERRAARLAALAERRPLTPIEFEELQRYLAAMRMICDTPYILDSDCRICPKLAELREILEERLAEPETKILIFSEWARMLELVRELARDLDAGFAWHTGSVPLAERRREVRRFKEDPGCRLFLSTDSGGVGLNLQAANLVINLDLPWNPARLEQRFARAWRKHQTRSVQAIHLVTENSIEQRMMPLLAQKMALAELVLDGRGSPEDAVRPGGRRAFLDRVQEILGPPRLLPPAAPPPRPVEQLRDDLQAHFGAGLLRLELRGETVLAVLKQVDATARAMLAEQVARRFGESGAPAVELLDEATYAVLGRLEAAGVLRFAAPTETLLDLTASDSVAAEELRLRAARARELASAAARKVRMATVLAAGGFPVEGLAPLREGIEGGIRALAALEGMEIGEDGAEPEQRRDNDRLRRQGIDPAITSVAAKLWGEPATLLALGDDEAHTWIAAGERFAGQLLALPDLAAGTG